MAPAMVPTDVPAEDVIARLPEARRADAEALVELMTGVTGEPPVVWASKILGFGQYDYRYDTGRGGTAPLAAFAPGPRQHTVYLPAGLTEEHADLVARLGAVTCGSACVYVKRLADVDLAVLRQLVEVGAQECREADVSR